MYIAVYNENNKAQLIAYSQYSVDKLIAASEPEAYATNLDAFKALVEQSIGETQYSIITEENRPTDEELIGATIDHDTLQMVQDQAVVDAHDLQVAIEFVADELPIADINVFYHEDSDSRAVATLSDWRDYRKALRNYVQAGAIATAKPVRPT